MRAAGARISAARRLAQPHGRPHLQGHLGPAGRGPPERRRPSGGRCRRLGGARHARRRRDAARLQDHRRGGDGPVRARAARAALRRAGARGHGRQHGAAVPALRPDHGALGAGGAPRHHRAPGRHRHRLPRHHQGAHDAVARHRRSLRDRAGRPHRAAAGAARGASRARSLHHARRHGARRGRVWVHGRRGCARGARRAASA